MVGVKDIIKDYIFVSLFAFFISVILTPLVRRSCQQKNILDFPGLPRKIHAVPVPRLGGIAIYLGFFLPLFSVLLTDGAVAQIFFQHVDVLLSLFATSTLVFAIGVYDDIRGATVSQKLLVQTTAAVIMYCLGFKIELISIPFVGSVSPGIFGLPLTILWIVGVTNALNFIDGVDGLACGVGFFAVSTMFILSLFLQRIITAFFAAALAGGLFGFALYNFAPASIFMGDSGSLFIGFIIATISLHGLQKSSTAVVLLLPIIALGVPITDTLLAIIRRIGNGHSPFTADKEHIHHRLLQMGLSTRQVTLLLYAVCALFGGIALLMTAVNNKALTLILLTLSVMVIGGMKMLGYTADMVQINHLAKERIQQRKRLFERQRCAERMLTEMRASPDLPTLKKAVIQYLEHMEFDVGMIQPGLHRSPDEMTEMDGKPFALRWHSPRYESRDIPQEQIWTLTVPIMFNEQPLWTLRGGKYRDPTLSFIESMVMVENLKEAIEQTLQTIHQKTVQVRSSRFSVKEALKR